MKGKWSAGECRLVWLNVSHPNINQHKWTPAESETLINLARKHGEKNWEQVNNELNVSCF